MSAVEAQAYEQRQPSTGEPLTPVGREFVGTFPTSEAGDAKVIPFPVKGVGEVALGSEIVVHQGSGSNRYLTRQSQTLSAAPNSHEYSMRARELANRDSSS